MPPVAGLMRHAFTLVELLVIIAVIAILAGLLFAGVYATRRKAAETTCVNNLRQFGIALISYRSDNRDRMPPWLSVLYPKYIREPKIYICRADRGNPPGSQGSKPDDLGEAVGEQFSETDDNKNNTTAPDRNPAIEYNSYMYEFSTAQCSWSWSTYLVKAPFDPNDPDPAKRSPEFVTLADVDKDGDGRVTWAEAKYWQLDHGDASYVNLGNPYSHSAFPVIRCFWHVTGRNGLTLNDRVLNLSYDGRVFISGLKWEETSK